MNNVLPIPAAPVAHFTAVLNVHSEAIKHALGVTQSGKDGGDRWNNVLRAVVRYALDPTETRAQHIADRVSNMNKTCKASHIDKECEPLPMFDIFDLQDIFDRHQLFALATVNLLTYFEKETTFALCQCPDVALHQPDPCASLIRAAARYGSQPTQEARADLIKFGLIVRGLRCVEIARSLPVANE